MRDLHNIEKSGFHKGEYVGYAGGAWKIYRNSLGSWTARKDGTSFTRRTLADISTALDATAEFLNNVLGAKGA